MATALVNTFDIDPFVLLLTGGPPEPIRPSELAGNSLTAYPYFEYVRAFNQNAPIKVAIDPDPAPRGHLAGDRGRLHRREEDPRASGPSTPPWMTSLPMGR